MSSKAAAVCSTSAVKALSPSHCLSLRFCFLLALSEQALRLQKSSYGYWALIWCFKIQTCLRMLSKRVPPFKTVGRSVRRFQCIWPLSCIAGNVGISQKRHDGHDFPEHSLSMSLFTTYQNHSLLYLDFSFFFQLVPCFTYIVKAFISALLLADKYQFKTRNNWFLLGAAEQAINTAQQIPEGNVCLFSCQVCHYVHDHWNGENEAV